MVLKKFKRIYYGFEVMKELISEKKNSIFTTTPSLIDILLWSNFEAPLNSYPPPPPPTLSKENCFGGIKNGEGGITGRTKIVPSGLVPSSLVGFLLKYSPPPPPPLEKKTKTTTGGVRGRAPSHYSPSLLPQSKKQQHNNILYSLLFTWNTLHNTSKPFFSQK